MFFLKTFAPKKKLGQKNFGLIKMLVPKNIFGPKYFVRSKKCAGPKSLIPKKISEKFDFLSRNWG